MYFQQSKMKLIKRFLGLIRIFDPEGFITKQSLLPVACSLQHPDRFWCRLCLVLQPTHSLLHDGLAKFRLLSLELFTKFFPPSNFLNGQRIPTANKSASAEILRLKISGGSINDDSLFIVNLDIQTKIEIQTTGASNSLRFHDN
jgi:hypothetical protein